MMSFILSVFIIVGFDDRNVIIFISSYFIISIFGFFDDIFVFSPIIKIVFQFLFCIYFLQALDLIKYTLDYKYLNIAMYSFCAVIVINAFNLIDGIDGLLILISILLIILVITIISHSVSFSFLFCIIMIGSLVGILPFNIAPARFFLGDSGSMALGWFFVVVLSFSILEGDLDLYEAIMILSIPIFDLISVAIYRFNYSNGNILRRLLLIKKADNNHIHHILLSKISAVSSTIFYIILINIIYLLIFYLIRFLFPIAAITQFSVVLCLIGHYYLRILIKNRIN